MKRVFLILALVFLSACWEVGTGEKIGVITRVAKTGAFCKTWEATIIRGGLNGGSGAFAQPFDFTIEGPEADDMAAKLTATMEAQQEVRIKYRSEMNTFCRSDSEDHFLTSYQVLNPNGK